MLIVPPDQIPTNVTDCPDDRPVEVYRICKQMHAVCQANNGVGLAAVQVGVPWRLFVLAQEDGSYRNFLNCLYSQDNPDKFESVEGCLSIRGPDGKMRYFKLDRFESITVAGRELIEKNNTLGVVAFQAKLSGRNLLNAVFQHEIDHQNGVLISDVGKEYELWTD